MFTWQSVSSGRLRPASSALAGPRWFCAQHVGAVPSTCLFCVFTDRGPHPCRAVSIPRGLGHDCPAWQGPHAPRMPHH